MGVELIIGGEMFDLQHYNFRLIFRGLHLACRSEEYPARVTRAELACTDHSRSIEAINRQREVVYC